MPLLSANVIICESVLTEKTDVTSAIRILNVLTVSPSKNLATFRVHTALASTPTDFEQHVVKVWMHPLDSAVVAAEAPEYRFVYGRKIDFSGPGAFNLTTDFNLDLRPLGDLGHYLIVVSLDGQLVARTPLTLRRG